MFVFYKKHALVISLFLLACALVFSYVGKSSTSASLLNCNTAVNIFVPAQECQALVDLYADTNGPSWAIQTNWDTDTNICTWYGITCGGSHVTEITLNGNNLQGTLPASMSGVTNLLEVIMNSNDLIGSLPSSRGSLSSMQDIQLANNDLSGPLPPSRSGLTNMRDIELNDNNLNGTLPDSWSALVPMQDMQFIGNDFTGNIPASWSGLTNLQQLRLTDNFFHGQIPASITGMVSLVDTDLMLANNCLDTNLPDPPASFVNTKAGGTGWESTQTCAGRPIRSDLFLTKSTNTSTPNAGGTVDYILSYGNKNNNVTGIVITDRLASGINYVSAAPAPTTMVGSLLTWDISDLMEQQTGVIVITGTIDPSVNSGTIIANSANISGSLNDTDHSNDTGSINVHVLGSAIPTSNLVVQKTIDNNTPIAGNNINYTITYANSGANAISGVTITDTLPGGLDSLSSSPTASSLSGALLPSASSSGDLMIWNIGTLAAGTTGSITVSATIDVGVASGTVIFNTAVISGQVNDTNPSDNTSAVSATLQGIPPALTVTGDLIIQKTADSMSPTIGSPLTYTLTYTNSGVNTVTGVFIQDTLPTGIDYTSASPIPDLISGSLLQWNIGTMTANETSSISIVTVVDSGVASGTMIENDATITGTLNELDPTSNTGSVTVDAIGPIVVVSNNNNGGGGGGGGSLGYAGGGMGTTLPAQTPTAATPPPVYNAPSDTGEVCPYHDGEFELYKNTFKDIKNSIYKGPVDVMLDHCLVQGNKNAGMVFAPYRYIRRSETYKVFVRLAGLSFDATMANGKKRATAYKTAGAAVGLRNNTSASQPLNGHITLKDLYAITNNFLEYENHIPINYPQGNYLKEGITRGNFAIFITTLIQQLTN